MIRFGKPKFYNSVEEAETASHPTRVRYLSVHDVDLDLYASRIMRFERLESLSLGWNYSNTELPRPIISLKCLTSLAVFNTPLEQFPEWLVGLPKLKRLIIRGTNIREIPSSIERFSSLRYVDLGNNDLTRVTSELGKLRKLRFLALPDNPLSSLPDEVLALPKLKGIGLAGTRFSEAEVRRIKDKFPNASVWPYPYNASQTW